ncbi:hypothetical protein [Youngiibacter fragilis]|uniref:Uncharacterized protein n=1 Tax=Youngiibacter fragilis 232.1 TaxID=994573 RepID=V7I7T0_9CLOT|nr:hypothetical protein [Youngiibacter fragilis]ETA81938.1 hypothetical protein T472_0203740 [Youngiibacter fragilis 232.1]
MFITIEDIIYYGRHNKDEYEGSYWWFDLHDYKIYSIDQLRSLFPDEIFTTEVNLLMKDIIPLFKTEIIEVEKVYIQQKNDKKMSEAFCKVSDDKFDQFFKKYIDEHLLLNDWWNFERKILISDCIEWCKSNRIRCRFKQR